MKPAGRGDPLDAVRPRRQRIRYASLTILTRCFLDKALEYRSAHTLRGQAATMHNTNLHDRFYPFCIRFGGCRDRLPADDERVQPCP